MKIGKILKDNESGQYTYIPEGETDGCTYKNLMEVIQTGILGFCGCGSPDENLDFIADSLDLIKTYLNGDNLYDFREKEHFGNKQSAMFFYYWADRVGLTEHGGSIPGWLTEEGEKLLELINEIEQ